MVAVIALSLGGCRDATIHPATNHRQASNSSGQFVVPQEDLPLQVVNLARALERLPNITSDPQFRSMLTMCDLNKEPDHYKDFGHFGYLDKAFKSETDPNKRAYHVSIGYLSAANSEIVFYFFLH
jgi:hypothetical protein